MTVWCTKSINALKEVAFVQDSFGKDMMSLVHGYLPLESKLFKLTRTKLFQNKVHKNLLIILISHHSIDDLIRNLCSSFVLAVLT